MSIDLEKKYSMEKGYDYQPLDISQLDLAVDVEHIEQYENEQYALLRKHGLGTSDSSILCGVNPYTTLPELIEEKSRDYLTPEERAIGDKVAVKKGRDLEPVIIKKHSIVMGKQILKPSDMYVSKTYPWMKFNYDGVIDKIDLGDGKYQYIPDEIKVVTAYGIKHYDISKAVYREKLGWLKDPEHWENTNNTILTKAAGYGIPPYYYTQLQQEIFGLNAPYGFLTVLFDSTWEMVSFLVYRDDNTIQTIIKNGYKTWEKIISNTHDPNRASTVALQEKFKKKEQPQNNTLGYKTIETS